MRLPLALSHCAAPSSVAARADFFIHPWEDFRSDEKRPHLIPTARFLRAARTSTQWEWRCCGSISSYTRFLPRRLFFTRLTRVDRIRARELDHGFPLPHWGKDTSYGPADQTSG